MDGPGLVSQRVYAPRRRCALSLPAIRARTHTHIYITICAPRSVLIRNNSLDFTTVGHHPDAQ